MPNEKGKATQKKLLCVDNLRHAEYYGQQGVFDELYAKSKNGEDFTDLMPLILSRDNILLAYRNIKTNTGSNTAGTDELTIGDIGRLTAEQVVEKVRFIITGSPHGYRPKAVRRKDIPKPYDPTKTRPLGIPCIWDRLIQQCVKQVMEPICEAKFSENSYGFRPNRSTEHAIDRTYRLMQLTHLHYVIEFDIKGFFDNVNHSKLIKQIWAMGIHDKHLLYVLRQMLTATVKMPNGSLIKPDKGTPQGGIISPLLANIVLNELDHWIDSQWQNNTVKNKYSKCNGYVPMRKTGLKEMYIVRYADDFRIFCRTKTDAERTKIAVTQWLSERLKLEVSQEKTRIVNVERRYSEFLGFKIKVHRKGQKQVVKSHISDKQLKHARIKLVEQAKRVARPRKGRKEQGEISLYNSMVMGIQNYYRIATNVNLDCSVLNRATMTVFTNQLRTEKGSRLAKHGRTLTEVEKKLYGKSQMLRYVAGADEPIYPIGYVKHKNPMAKKRSICQYTVEGREGLHDNLRINVSLMRQLMRQPLYDRSAEYADNRISLFSAQWGKCAVTGSDFQCVADIHCHHKLQRQNGGNDKYENLTLVLEPVHKLIHATQKDTIDKYLGILQLNNAQRKKLNVFREKAGLFPLT
ncbi:group II intron reverse transcriptase/maturase [Clostridia bacterium]|nr:group II intron reverse transcriptase/maturase [Clostridia bacterium]